MQLVLDLNPPGAQLIAIVFFLIPGLLFLWTFERLAGRTRLRGTERLLRAVAWSTAIYALCSPWVVHVIRRASAGRSLTAAELVGGASVLVFVLPVVTGFVMAQFRWSEPRNALLRRFTVVDPAPTSWDYAFTAGGPYFLRAKLRDGERVGGFYGDGSFASSYPEPQDLYLEEAWRLTRDGAFLARLEGSRGLLLKRDDVEVLELFDGFTPPGRQHAKPP
jgi:hypothetical protein